MGIIKSVFMFPFRIAGKGISATRKALSGEPENPIEEIIPTRHPMPYAYYHSDRKSDYINGKLIIWKPNTEKQREKFLKELGKVS